MWSIIASIVQGFFSAVTGPVAQAVTSIMNKKADVTLAGWQAATAADQANYITYADYQAKITALQLQQNSAFGIWTKILYFIAGLSAVVHYAAVNLDSTFLFHWHVAQLPGVYESYEGWVVGSLFVHAVLYKPLNAATNWLHRN